MPETIDKTDWKRVDALTDKDIAASIAEDPDTFEPTDAMFSRATSVADSNLPESIKRAARGGRPRQDVTKQMTTIRLPTNVVEFFKAGSKDGKGWQTRLSAALEEYVAEHKHG